MFAVAGGILLVILFFACLPYLPLIMAGIAFFTLWLVASGFIAWFVIGILSVAFQTTFETGTIVLSFLVAGGCVAQAVIAHFRPATRS